MTGADSAITIQSWRPFHRFGCTVTKKPFNLIYTSKWRTILFSQTRLSFWRDGSG